MSQLVTTARIIDKTDLFEDPGALPAEQVYYLTNSSIYSVQFSGVLGNSTVTIQASNTAGMSETLWATVATAGVTGTDTSFHADLREYSAIKVIVSSADASPCAVSISVLSLGADL